VGDRPDERPGPLALRILSAATIADLKADAAEVAELLAVSDAPLPMEIEHQMRRRLQACVRELLEDRKVV
jgi:hypothetical protein